MSAVAITTLLCGVVSPVLSAGYCDVNECSKSPINTIVPAYYICKAAMIDGVFAPEVASAGYTFEYLQGICSGFCEADSRTGYDSHSGAVWDICAGCDTETTANICTICDVALGVQNNAVGVCSTNHANTACVYEAGDGSGAQEEYIGEFLNMEVESAKAACFDLVRSHRPTANGATFSVVDGACYAEYQVADAPLVDAAYFTCKFQFGSPTPAPIGQPSFPPPTDPADRESNGQNGQGSSTTTIEPNTASQTPLNMLVPTYIEKGKKGSTQQNTNNKKGGKKEKGKKGKLGFMSQTKNVVGVSVGGLVLMVAATAMVVQRRRRMQQQAELTSDALLQVMSEHTPLMDEGTKVYTGVPVTLEEMPPIMS